MNRRSFFSALTGQSEQGQSKEEELALSNLKNPNELKSNSHLILKIISGVIIAFILMKITDNILFLFGPIWAGVVYLIRRQLPPLHEQSGQKDLIKRGNQLLNAAKEGRVGFTEAYLHNMQHNYEAAYKTDWWLEWRGPSALFLVSAIVWYYGFSHGFAQEQWLKDMDVAHSAFNGSRDMDFKGTYGKVAEKYSSDGPMSGLGFFIFLGSVAYVWALKRIRTHAVKYVELVNGNHSKINIENLVTTGTPVVTKSTQKPEEVAEIALTCPKEALDSNLTDELIKLHGLLKAGALTQVEFNEAKSRVLKKVA